MSGHGSGTRYSRRYYSWCTGMYSQSHGAAALLSRGADTNANPFVDGLTGTCDESALWWCFPLALPLPKKPMTARVLCPERRSRCGLDYRRRSE